MSSNSTASASTDKVENETRGSSDEDKEQQAAAASVVEDNAKNAGEGEDGRKDTEPEEASSAVDMLQQMMARALHMQGKDEQDVPQLLDEVSFEGVARYIKSGKVKNIVTMVGAGISTSAGIPDFRTPGSGLYDNLQQYDLPHPQAIFMIDFFRENPKPFFVLAKELFPGSFKPTVSHYFVRMLNERGLLLRHYTQNIDTLERVAGIPSEKLVEAHGTFQSSYCLECGAKYDLPWMKEKIFADEIPRCTDEDCTGLVKPAIVFFGESLPPRFVMCAAQDLKECDMLVVMGTSLVVQPFASLVHRVPPSTPRLYINLEKSTPEGDFMSILMGHGGGFRFDDENNIRDVFHKSDCDSGCLALADQLGWGEELRTLVETEHKRIDGEKVTEEKTSPGGASSL